MMVQQTMIQQMQRNHRQQRQGHIQQEQIQTAREEGTYMLIYVRSSDFGFPTVYQVTKAWLTGTTLYFRSEDKMYCVAFEDSTMAQQALDELFENNKVSLKYRTAEEVRS